MRFRTFLAVQIAVVVIGTGSYCASCKPADQQAAVQATEDFTDAWLISVGFVRDPRHSEAYESDWQYGKGRILDPVIRITFPKRVTEKPTVWVQGCIVRGCARQMTREYIVRLIDDLHDIKPEK